MELRKSLDLISIQLILLCYFRFLASHKHFEYSLKLFSSHDGHGLIKMVETCEFSNVGSLTFHFQNVLCIVNVLKVTCLLRSFHCFLCHLKEVPWWLLQHHHISSFKSAGRWEISPEFSNTRGWCKASSSTSLTELIHSSVSDSSSQCLKSRSEMMKDIKHAEVTI